MTLGEDHQADLVCDARIPVIGIGASAGGFEALQCLLGAVPADCGLAFVVIQHLAPNQPSMLAELLARRTALDVGQIQGETPIVLNHVYVAPPHHHVEIRKGTLRLAEGERTSGVPVAIDRFFRSLAADLQDKAIGVILSGTGHDGTQGARAIKEQGGLVIVQDPATAAFDGMPCSALATGQVDHVLPAGQIADALLQYVRHTPSRGEDDHTPPLAAGIDAILGLLQLRTRHNFRCYKRSSLNRRIRRRMVINHIHDMSVYLDFLRDNPDEQQRLVQDCLISVTRFFRDPEAFAALTELAIRPLLHRSDPDQPIRVWVPGCATGEEAYSLGMLLLEEGAAAGRSGPLQIFASDIDDSALAAARTGVYPDTIAADVPAGRLRQFFLKEDSTYRIARPLREIVTFSVQNMITDPPFARLDLISCRNVFIYIDPEAQRTVLDLFHFALREDGCLFLGSAETVGPHGDLFAPLSKSFHLYRRVGSNRFGFAFPMAGFPDQPLAPRPIRTVSPRELRPAELVQQWVMTTYAPPMVLINRHHEVLYVSGDVGRYLVLPAGEARLDLMAMARDGLQARLRSAIHQAVQDGGAVSIAGIPILRDPGHRTATVTVEPVDGTRDLLLVIFKDEPVPSSASPPTLPPPPGDPAIIERMEQELADTRKDLQGLHEQLETTNKEYGASIEEAMSINEEFQSTNEELETSKEELESINEEITTLNNELKLRLDELESVNNDIANLLISTDLATIFLDADLRITRFTPATRGLLNLIAGDIGRPIADFAFRYAGAELQDDARQVIDRLVPIERRMTAADGTSFIRRVMPYRTTDNRIAGAVITFTDVTSYKKIETTLEEKVAEFEAMMEAAPAAVWIAGDPACQRIAGNRAAAELLRIPANPTNRIIGSAEEWMSHCRIVQDGVAVSIPDLPLQRAARDEVVRNIELDLCFADGVCRTIFGNAVPRRDAQGRSSGAVAVFIDITDRKRSEAEQERANRKILAAQEEAVHANAAKTRFLAAASHDLRQPTQALVLFQDLLARQNRDPKLAPIIARIGQSLSAQQQMLNSLLDMSQLEAGIVEVKKIAFPIGAVMERMANEFTVQAEEKGLRLRVVRSAAVIATDPGLLERILRNLLTNAVKYTDHGGILLGCRRAGSGVKVGVRDTGAGIPPDQITRIFEEFAQLGNPERDRSKGLGLGLSIVDRLARLLDHRLAVRSVVGQGTVVEVEVPLARSAPQQTSADPGSMTPRQGGFVVVIDDDPDVLQAIRLSLEAMGYRVVAGPSLEVILPRVQEQARSPEVMIADYRLAAGRTGTEAVRHLQSEFGKPLLSILLTGDTSPERLQEAKRSGHLLLHKPIKFDELAAAIGQALSRRS